MKIHIGKALAAAEKGIEKIKRLREKEKNDIIDNNINSRTWYGKLKYKNRQEVDDSFDWWMVDILHGYEYERYIDVINSCKMVGDAEEFIDFPFEVAALLGKNL